MTTDPLQVSAFSGFEPPGFQMFLDAWKRCTAGYQRLGPVFADAIIYAMASGGKLVRPKLCLLAAAAVDGTWSASTQSVRGQKDDDSWSDHLVIGCAVALEMIHTYSLIHDDLPCMDDDDMRRGRPTLHRKFNEATALLTGDALLTDAFGIVAACYGESGRIVDCVRVLSAASGGQGMVLGQMLDLQNQDGALGGDARAVIERIHSLKTGGLIQASLVTGAVAAGADDRVVEGFKRAGSRLGLAFQIADDLLDVADNTGKTSGKDARVGKKTFLDILGHESGVHLVEDLTAQAIKDLKDCGCLTREIELFVRMLSRRGR